MPMAHTINDLRQRLEDFLAEQTGRPTKVTQANQLAGGASRASWAIDAEPGPLHLVLRIDIGGEIQQEALSRAEEFRVLAAAVRAGVRAPQPRWLCADPAVLGAPFFLMDRLEGEAVGRRVVREPGLAAARRLLPRQMAEQLALIHNIDWRTEGLSFLPAPDAGRSSAESALDRAARQLWRLGEPHPALELGLRWLRGRAPQGGETVFVHGDFRIGNLLVGPDGLQGVLDWEFAHVGDYHEDLAWPCVRSWRFGNDDMRLGGVGDLEEFVAAYESASGRRVDRRAMAFWEVLGNLRWAVGCMAQAHRHLSGQSPSLEFASLGRRTAEMELELLDLIERAERGD
jgi:aminoglycoside phosphotransferase (APT) family kinase protein